MLQNKFLVGAIVLGVSSVAFASGDYMPTFKPGFYVGIQGGLGQVDEGSALKDSMNHYYDIATALVNEDELTSATKSIDDSDWVTGRLLVGYNFSPYVSVEAGYTLFPMKKYGVTATGEESISSDSLLTQELSSTYTQFREYRLNTYAVDLVGKVIYPFGNSMDMYSGWNVYAKLGVAYVHAAYDYAAIDSFSIHLEDHHNQWSANSYGERTVVTALRPTYGLGIGYNFNENFGIDLSWMGIYGGQDRFDVVADNFAGDKDHSNRSLLRTRNVIPTTNFVAIGVSYKFVKV
jgi:hypothetical protein